ncbi:2'-5' RNA ligase family protein [Rothia mucilaginosa]|uniref:2'-5' RNA ligase family protein n=2 Tax=Rothia TaxID=32207 RepID=UPI0028D6488A|nr:2'-5' RNA ligase family protein [uncultured Rothia sp.]
MTAQENSSSPTKAPVSPTLKPGHRYLSVIAHVSGENAQRLEEWKRTVVGGAAAPISTHVTVYLAELNESLLEAFQSPKVREALDVPRFEARWGTVHSFRPVTEVEYLNLEAGKAEFEQIHQKLVELFGAGAASFPYVPHVTLGHGLTEAQVANAHKVFDALPAEQRTFTVDHLHYYSYDGQNWEEIGVLPLR